MKPVMHTSRTRLMPKREARNPVGGVMIAAATIYEVSTQAISSWLADTLPCI